MKSRLAIYGILGVCFWVGATLLLPMAQRDRKGIGELVYFPSGTFLKQAVLDYDQAASSLAWLRMVQYYGSHVRTDRDFAKIDHLAQITTDLDPHFEAPYVFGSFILLTDRDDPDSGMKLLEKGLRHNPESWRILAEGGLVTYLGYRDYERAAGYYRKAAAQPGAPEYISRFAAFMTDRAGSPEASLILWNEALQRTENPMIRARIEQQIEIVRAKLASGGES